VPASTLAFIIAYVLYIYSSSFFVFFFVWLETAVFLYYPSLLFPFFFFFGFKLKFYYAYKVMSELKYRLFGFLYLFKGLG
jgi:hypothetical protein